MSLGATDTTMCRLFPLTLSDQAHRWFTSLTPNSIKSFEQLVRLFLSHFATMAPRLATEQHLSNVWKANDETDRAYLERIYILYWKVNT